jgi:predicted TIM-barrel fold metal-dependent hydrolase
MVEANPARLLWASDWPYVRMGNLAPDVGHLIDLFHKWIGDEAICRKILVENPAALYGFPA